jgi:uncharacterized protein (DUF433 family)
LLEAGWNYRTDGIHGGATLADSAVQFMAVWKDSHSAVRDIVPPSRPTLVPPGFFGYSAAMAFTRITIDPAICTGKPCIRGLRFPVARLLGLLAAGETREQILRNYPYLEPEDIDEALRYAAFLADDETIELCT